MGTMSDGSIKCIDFWMDLFAFFVWALSNTHLGLPNSVASSLGLNIILRIPIRIVDYTDIYSKNAKCEEVRDEI